MLPLVVSKDTGVSVNNLVLEQTLQYGMNLFTAPSFVKMTIKIAAKLWFAKL